MFNLETDEASDVLSQNSSVIKQFANHFDFVYVYSTHVGNFSFPDNVRVVETGGGRWQLRVLALFRLTFALVKAFRFPKKTFVFHHMSTKTLLWPGIIFKALRIRSAIWYSHSESDFFLRLLYRQLDFVFSPTNKTFPLKSSKLVPIGHMIDFEGISTESNAIDTHKVKVLTVGRVTRVKRIEEIVKALFNTRSLFGESKEFELFLIGPCADALYLHEIQTLSKKQRVATAYLGPLKREQLMPLLGNYDFYFQGTPQSVDKATLEAAAAGCIPITQNRSVFNLTGLSETKEGKQLMKKNLAEQIVHLVNLHPEELKQLRQTVSICTREKNDYRKTVALISQILKND